MAEPVTRAEAERDAKEAQLDVYRGHCDHLTRAEAEADDLENHLQIAVEAGQKLEQQRNEARAMVARVEELIRATRPHSVCAYVHIDPHNLRAALRGDR